MAAALLVLAGCDTPKESRAEEPHGEAQLLGGPEAPAGVGALATAADYEMSVEEVRDCVLSPPFHPEKGNKKLAVEVVIEGTTDREVPVNPFYAHLETAAGDFFEVTLAGCKPVLRAERVTRGGKARGVLTFEVPASARKLQLVYAPTVIGGGREELRFDLGV